MQMEFEGTTKHNVKTEMASNTKPRTKRSKRRVKGGKKRVSPCFTKLKSSDDSDDIQSDETDEETEQLTDDLKDQQTSLYRLTMRLFNSLESKWHNIELTMQEIIEEDGLEAEISPEDRVKCLGAMQQYMESHALSKEKELEPNIQHLKCPLNAEEQLLLESITKEDWARMEKAAKGNKEARDLFQAHMKLLIREYNNINGEKPKKCTHCGKRYTATTSVLSHMHSVSGVRFFYCSKCWDGNDNCSFTRKNSLYYHILKENNIPRYVCNTCNKMHNHTHHQKCHARQHTGEKIFVCQACMKSFSSRSSFCDHLLHTHNIEPRSDNIQIQLTHDDVEQKRTTLKTTNKGTKRKDPNDTFHHFEDTENCVPHQKKSKPIEGNKTDSKNLFKGANLPKHAIGNIMPKLNFICSRLLQREANITPEFLQLIVKFDPKLIANQENHKDLERLFTVVNCEKGLLEMGCYNGV